MRTSRFAAAARDYGSGIKQTISKWLEHEGPVPLRWRDVWQGALATAVLFTIGKVLLGLYLGKAAVGSAYGAAGSLIVVIVWVYYFAMIFYFGAEYTRMHTVGPAPGPAKKNPRGPLDREASMKQKHQRSIEASKRDGRASCRS